MTLEAYNALWSERAIAYPSPLADRSLPWTPLPASSDIRDQVTKKVFQVKDVGFRLVSTRFMGLHKSVPTNKFEDFTNHWLLVIVDDTLRPWDAATREQAAVLAEVIHRRFSRQWPVEIRGQCWNLPPHDSLLTCDSRSYVEDTVVERFHQYTKSQLAEVGKDLFGMGWVGSSIARMGHLRHNDNKRWAAHVRTTVIVAVKQGTLCDWVQATRNFLRVLRHTSWDVLFEEVTPDGPGTSASYLCLQRRLLIKLSPGFGGRY